MTDYRRRSAHRKPALEVAGKPGDDATRTLLYLALEFEARAHMGPPKKKMAGGDRDSRDR
jgi:hypothetical protein